MMGLTMEEKKSITKEIAERYKNADKDEKKEILDQYAIITGFHRKYAISKINACIKRKTYVFNNKTLTSCKVEVPKRKKRMYKKKNLISLTIKLVNSCKERSTKEEKTNL